MEIQERQSNNKLITPLISGVFVVLTEKSGNLVVRTATGLRMGLMIAVLNAAIV